MEYGGMERPLKFSNISKLSINLNSLIITTTVDGKESLLGYRKFSMRAPVGQSGLSDKDFIRYMFQKIEKLADIEEGKMQDEFDRITGQNNSSQIFGFFVKVFNGDGSENSPIKRLAQATNCSSNLEDWKIYFTCYKPNLETLDEPNLPPLAKINTKKVRKMSDVEKKVKEEIEKSQESRKRQIVFTGAPGTGKTYSVERYVDEQVKTKGAEKEFVQFHSSFDYTDFVEGLRPVEDRKGSMKFVRMDGIFKEFCRRAAAETIREAYKEKYNTDPTEIPVEEANNLIRSYKKSPQKYFYFIIDEINRADLGRVFGELMYCFEKRGPRHTVQTQYSNLHTHRVNKNGGKLRFKGNGKIDGDVFAEGFYIPENVIVIGTMNDIDRSVETFDFALRRRFDWVEIEADEVMLESFRSMNDSQSEDRTIFVDDDYKIIELYNMAKALNEVIAGTPEKPRLGKEFKIGPAYFKGYDGNNLKDIWDRNIEPILREYMRGRKDDGFIDKCKKALFNNDTTNEEGNPPAEANQIQPDGQSANQSDSRNAGEQQQ